jgi:hypothetical protein
MAKSSTTWGKGKSGNLKGRPPKNRALTRLLQESGENPLIIGGQQLTGQQALAHRIWEFVATGQVLLGDEPLKAESIADWLTTVKWLYTHIDGPAKSAPETEIDNEIILTVVRESPNIDGRGDALRRPERRPVLYPNQERPDGDD